MATENVPSTVEERRIALDEKKAEQEYQLRLAELNLKRTESGWAARLFTPLTTTIFAGILTLAGSAIGTLLQGRSTLQLEREKFDANRTLEQQKQQHELILKMVSVGDEKQARANLMFLAETKLLEGGLAERILALKDTPVLPSTAPASSTSLVWENPVAYSQAIVDRIRSKPGVLRADATPDRQKRGDHTVMAIILHTSGGPDDGSLRLIRSGRPDLPGPLAHWAVTTDGSVIFIADETRTVFHLGQGKGGLNNRNTIGIEATGHPAFPDDRQVESLVRLVADVADSWDIPTDMILSHAEAASPAGRKLDMLQQAPAIRRMVDAVRTKKPAPADFGSQQ